MPSTKITRKFDGGVAPGSRADTRQLANYNASFDVKLPANLNEELSGVTAQIFPLPADINKMQRFLDRYLNFPDPPGPDAEEPPVYFKPAAPFVLLEIANYSKISENVRNVGWFSQREIAFGMVLEWYARKGDDIEFLKYALIYPYVYVDNELGIAGGREIYGWSKAPIEVAVLRKLGKDLVPEPVAPVFDRPTDEMLFGANLLIPQDLPNVEDLPTKLIEIRQSRYFQAAASAIPDLLTAAPRAMTASISAAWDLTKFVWGSGSYLTRQVYDLPKVLPQYRGIATKFLPSWITQHSGSRASDSKPAGSATSVITLKQVRDVNRGPLACYEGIVESTMRIECISDGGSLIDLTNPDPSAGIWIDLYGRNGQEPEMLELGIQCQELTRDARSPDQRLFGVAPFLPFWVEMNLKYGPADFQAWRTDWTPWTQNNNPTYRQSQRSIPYIRLGAGAPLEIEPPTLFPNVRMRFLPLPARKAVIDGLIKDYLANNPPNSYFTFTRNGHFHPNSGAPDDDDHQPPAVVVAILSDFEKMEPQSYSDYEMTFVIPITWTDNRTGKSGAGFMHAFTFASTYWNTITTTEVYGRSTLKSNFVPAPFTSVLPPRLDRPNLALTVKSELFRDGGRDQPAEELSILKVYELFSSQSNPTSAILQRTVAPSGPGVRRRREITVQSLLPTLGLEAFLNNQPFYSIALKQIRDANDTAKADYQASVWLQRSFTPKDSNFYKPELELHLFEYTNFSVKRALGLIDPTQIPNAPPKDVWIVKPILPFLVEGSLNPGPTYIGWWNIGNKWQPPIAGP
jgi:hypothetical protein